MIFQYPWLFLFVAPLMWTLWVYTPHSTIVKLLRLAITCVLTLGLVNPSCTVPTTQQNIIVVVDRSDSMPRNVDDMATETIQELEKSLGQGDNLAVLSVAQTVILDKALNQTPFQGFNTLEQRSQSNLESGLQKALQLLDNKPHGKIVLLSDGANTDGSLDSASTQALIQTVPIFPYWKTKRSKSDIRISNVSAPPLINEGEQASITTFVDSPSQQEALVTLYKDNTAIAQGQKLLEKGRNTIHFTDIPTSGGVHTYKIDVAVEGDSTPQNNQAEIGVLTKGRKKVLLLSLTDSVLKPILQSAGLLVHSTHPGNVDLSPATLSQFQTVILHNVPATQFQEVELENLANAVEHTGLGLWMVGGAQSFGVGGYLHSSLESVIPVELEIRSERRKMGMALAIALDRSGSMGVSVGPNLTKMDLANQGTVAALSLLTPMDSIYVAAVDTENHTVVPMQTVESPRELTSNVMKIKSDGGGIYVSTALESMLNQLKDAPQKNRHGVLFADAADAVDNNNTLSTVDELRKNNITLSVIALGNPADSDAGFLAQVARDGGGSLYFAQHPKELPKLFAMDTMLASKSGYVEEVVSTKSILGLTPLGGTGLNDFPEIEAYNIGYPKKNSQLGMQTGDTEPTPLLTYGRYGLGQSVAYLGDIGGPNGQHILKWTELSQFVNTIVSGISQTEADGVSYAGISGTGDKKTITIETNTPPPPIRILADDGSVEFVDLVQTNENIYQANYTPKGTGVFIAQLESSRGTTTLPPISQVTTMEYGNSDSHNNKETMMELASRTGGIFNPSIANIVERHEFHSQRRSLELLWQWLTLGLLLCEISERKLRWIQKFAQKFQRNNPRQQKVPPFATPPKSAVAPTERNTESAHQTIETPSDNTEPEVSSETSTQNAKKTSALQEALKRAKNQRNKD